MNPVTIILIVSAVITVMLNVFASYRVMKSEQLESSQTILQCILIWLIPLFGAGLCIALTREPKPGVLGYRNHSETLPDISFDEGSGHYFQP